MVKTCETKKKKNTAKLRCDGIGASPVLSTPPISPSSTLTLPHSSPPHLTPPLPHLNPILLSGSAVKDWCLAGKDLKAYLLVVEVRLLVKLAEKTS